MGFISSIDSWLDSLFSAPKSPPPVFLNKDGTTVSMAQAAANLAAQPPPAVTPTTPAVTPPATTTPPAAVTPPVTAILGSIGKGASNADTYNNFITNVRKGTTQQAAKIPADLATAVKNAAQATGVPADLLTSLAAAEDGTFSNGAQKSGPGKATGYFQIDTKENPDVSVAQAQDPTFAANWAANRLNSNLQYFMGLKSAAPVTSSIHAYNAGKDPANWNNPYTQGDYKRLASYLQQNTVQ